MGTVPNSALPRWGRVNDCLLRRMATSQPLFRPGGCGLVPGIENSHCFALWARANPILPVWTVFGGYALQTYQWATLNTISSTQNQQNADGRMMSDIIRPRFRAAHVAHWCPRVNATSGVSTFREGFAPIVGQALPPANRRLLASAGVRCPCTLFQPGRPCFTRSSSKTSSAGCTRPAGSPHILPNAFYRFPDSPAVPNRSR